MAMFPLFDFIGSSCSESAWPQTQNWTNSSRKSVMVRMARSERCMEILCPQTSGSKKKCRAFPMEFPMDIWCLCWNIEWYIMLISNIIVSHGILISFPFYAYVFWCFPTWFFNETTWLQKCQPRKHPHTMSVQYMKWSCIWFVNQLLPGDSWLVLDLAKPNGPRL